MLTCYWMGIDMLTPHVGHVTSLLYTETWQPSAGIATWRANLVMMNQKIC